MNVAQLLRASAVMVGLTLWATASAQQQSSDDRYKEVHVASGRFSLGDPAPSWVDIAAIPDTANSQPVVVRLADTQPLVGDIPTLSYRRATLINDPASLTDAGRFSISFAPEYQRVKLHSIYLHRGGVKLDRTTTSTIRFLQREQDLEYGVYDGLVAASVLVDDLRVGDTLEYAYSLQGQNPVFNGKYVSLASWDQGYPALLRRVTLNHPVSRKISWRMIGDRSFPSVVPKETIHGDVRKLEFEGRPIPEIESEPQTPRDYFPYRFLQFSEFAVGVKSQTGPMDYFKPTGLLAMKSKRLQTKSARTTMSSDK